MVKAVSVVIVAAGRKQRKVASRAGQLWVGDYHSTCLLYAESLTTRNNIYILSPSYGIVPLDRVLTPTNLPGHGKRPSFLSLSKESGITIDGLKHQAQKYGILNSAPVVLGSLSFISICKKLWPNCKNPMRDSTGMGDQIRRMRGTIGRKKLAEVVPYDSPPLTLGRVMTTHS